MKFLCDRCKTRYSIGDDRVRGKILKIRCKNCANVITVREGMTDVDPAEAQQPATSGRRNPRPTTAAPLVAQSSALAARSGSGLAELQPKPPAALEEEWYVSIDGDQDGPFTLVDAQQWVTNKPYDAELHCWSEGFDDWLPVDKVSHFRGLRKRPQPVSAPPPLPRIAPSPSAPMPLSGIAQPRPASTSASPIAPIAVSAPIAPIAPIVPRDEETPKPLFAATMASLEKSSPGESGSGLPPLGSMQMRGPAAQPSATPPHGVPANGSNGSVTSHVPTSQGIGAVPATSSSASLPPASRSSFDTSEASQVGHRPMFEGKATDPAPPARPGTVDDGNDLDFSEVSRVVKLADIARPPAAGTAQARRSVQMPAARPMQVGRVTGNRTGTFPLVQASGKPVVAPAHHRRGLAMLLGVAAVVVIGVAAAVIYTTTQDSDDTSHLNNVSELNTDRPSELIVRATPPQPGSNGLAGSNGSAGSNAKPNGQQTAVVQHPHPAGTPDKGSGATTNPSNKVDTPPAGPGATVSLRSDEIEDMYGKHKFGAERCYMRAQKDQFLGDVKRIQVTLAVDKEGSVTDVTLDSHKDDVLGKCLSNQVRSWKFRASPGGTYRFTMAFAN